MVFTTFKEIAKCAFGAFDDRAEISEQSRSATGAALGSLVLLAVSAWLSQPLYYQYAANQNAQNAGGIGWIAAAVVALLIFSFGADIARNIARVMKGKRTDNAGSIALIVVIWAGLSGFDILVQYYGSEIRARESSGDIRASLQDDQGGGGDTVAISPAIAAEYESLADVDFMRSWCGKHQSKHGNSYRDAMTRTAAGIWSFVCKDQQPSFGKKYDQQRAEIRARIEEIKDLETEQKRIDQAALNDANAGILDIRKATEKSFKFLTFALYLICLGFSIRVCLFLEDLESLESDLSAQSRAGVTSTQNKPKTQQRANTAAQKPGLFQRFRNWGKKPLSEPGRAVPSGAGGYQIVCQNPDCGKTVVMKSHFAKYCCDECRKNAFTARTGVKVQHGKKGNNNSKPGRIGFI